MEDQSKALTVFNFEEQEIRTVMIDSKIWFVAADVCKALGIASYRQAVNGSSARDEGLDEDERGYYNVYTPGGVQQMLCVNESGLQELIWKSRKPKAKAFKRWVKHDVIPAIATTGVYDPAGQIPALQAQTLQAIQQQLEAIGQSQINMELFINSIEENLELAFKIGNPGEKLMQQEDWADLRRICIRLMRQPSVTPEVKRLLQQSVRGATLNHDYMEAHRGDIDDLYNRTEQCQMDVKIHQKTMQTRLETLQGVVQQIQQMLPPAQQNRLKEIEAPEQGE